MRRSLLAASVSVAALLSGLGFVSDFKAEAAPVAPVTVPMDTPNATVNVVVNALNASYPEFQYVQNCTGNTTGNCTPGQRIVESVTNLATTPGGNFSATVTVTDSAVAAASDVYCNVEGYIGNSTNGVPTVANITANAGNFTFTIQNTGYGTSGNLSSTVPVHCLILNP